MRVVFYSLILILTLAQAQSASDLVSSALSDFLGGNTEVLSTEAVAELEPGVLSFEPTPEGRAKAADAFYAQFGKTANDADPLLTFIGTDLDFNELQTWIDEVSFNLGFSVNNIADVAAFKTIYSYLVLTNSSTTTEADTVVKNFFSTIYAQQPMTAEQKQIETQKDLMELYLLSYYNHLLQQGDQQAPSAETVKAFATKLMKAEGFDPDMYRIGERGIEWGAVTESGVTLLGERTPNPNGTGDTNNLLAGKHFVAQSAESASYHFCPDGSLVIGIGGDMSANMALGTWQLEPGSTAEAINYLLITGDTPEYMSYTLQADGSYLGYNNSVQRAMPSSICPLETQNQQPTTDIEPTTETVAEPTTQQNQPFGGLFGSTAEPLSLLSGQQFAAVDGRQTVHFCSDNSLILEANGDVFGRGSWTLLPDSSAQQLTVMLALTEQYGQALPEVNEVRTSFTAEDSGTFASTEFGSSFTPAPSVVCSN